MFGTYRLILAFMVVFLHLGGWPGFGEYAVFTFFCLSGYLMTFIMQENYGYTLAGQKKYLFNRLLRIYPLYLAAAMFSLLVIFLLGEEYTSGIIFNLKYPDSLSNSLSNAFLMITDHKHVALVPPAWALTVELLYYGLIGMGLSKNRTITWIWLALSLGYTVVIHILKLAWWDWGYFHPLAASLPFSLGALLYHYKKPLTQYIKPIANPQTALLLYGLVLINWAINYKMGTLFSYGFYLNSLINILLLVTLTNLSIEGKAWKKWDKTLGDLSYPIYLMHWTIAVVVMYLFSLFDIELKKRTELFAIVSIPFMLLFSQVIVSLLHRPVETIRNRNKD